MIQLERITSPDNPLIDPLIGLYTEAFPENERRTITQLREWIEEKTEMYFAAITDKDELCGLIVYWQFDAFVYLEHFAVFAEMRNRKIGQQVLDHLNTLGRLPIILEAEPPLDEISERRVNYYSRNGYVVSEKEYIQPPYPDTCTQPLPLWIMAKPEIPAEELKLFIRQIKQTVYCSKQ